MRIRWFAIALLAAAINQASSPVSVSAQAISKPDKALRLAVMCFKSGEQVSGMNKICYYNCLGSTTAINISSTALCPQTIDR